ncbi:MAG: LPP20 family lipoprotein [Elusimicrobia bacterium]|nr:LPP20 family lipoprotein [Elusimicrobiota bacterium]
MRSANAVTAKFSSFLFAAALALAAGCATRHVPGPIAEKGPEWVNKGNGAFKDGGQGAFYGVGIAQGIRNRALAVTASDDRARAEIAKIMETYIAVLTKDYMASTTAGDMSKSSEEQHVSSTLKSFAKVTLRGAMIIDHWKDPSDGTLFALCKLDLAAVKRTLEESKELDNKMRDFVRANAEKAFDELSAEEAKH